MDFYSALRLAVESGVNITRKEWGDAEYYGCIFNGQLMLHKPDGVLYSWIISDGDIAAQDWMMIGEFVND